MPHPAHPTPPQQFSSSAIPEQLSVRVGMSHPGFGTALSLCVMTPG
jgi:hypothetical protein